MKKLSFIQGAVFAIACSSVIGIAATVTGLNTFTSGTPISSSQMNTNFTILKNAIESTSSQVYLGTHDASTAMDPTGATTAGEYYIITTAGTTPSGTYAVGDWAMFDGTSYSLVPSTSLVTSVFGRTGVIAALEGDYTLTKLADVDVTTTAPITGQMLTYTGSQWVNQTFIELDPQTQSFAKTPPPTCAGGEFLKSNGSTLSCVPGAVPFSGMASKVVTTDGSGNLISSSISTTELNYLAGATIPIASLTSTINTKADINNGTQTITALAVTGLTSPVASSDATSKIYVDSLVTTSIIANGVWNKSGGDIYYPSGNVGIGTSTPSYLLTVNGLVAGTAAFVVSSDQRYKKEITRIPDALEKILAIDGVSYKFKNEEFTDKNFSKRRELGVIAQTVEKVFPEAVTKDKEGFRSVAYTMLISPIIEAIRELDTKSKSLEAENRMLKDYLCQKDPSAPFCEE